MKRLMRVLMFGAVVGWATKYLADLRRRWMTQPAAEIRHRVDLLLPQSIDPVTRRRIADRAVLAVKGPLDVELDDQPPSQGVPSPPVSDTPAGFRPKA